MKRPRLRTRFWPQTGFSALAGALALLTLITREWIEVLTGWDPDRGNASLEWLIVGVLGVVAFGFGLAARAEWRYPRVPSDAR